MPTLHRECEVSLPQPLTTLMQCKKNMLVSPKFFSRCLNDLEMPENYLLLTMNLRLFLPGNNKVIISIATERCVLH